MTRKDYELIASTIKERRAREIELGAGGKESDLVFGVLDSLAQQFADILSEENPRFDRVRFLVASGTKKSAGIAR